MLGRHTDRPRNIVFARKAKPDAAIQNKTFVELLQLHFVDRVTHVILRWFPLSKLRKDTRFVTFCSPFTAHRSLLSAFTLAEVLITLGIIGVVAALTIPTLMNNIQDNQYKTAYKKAYSALSQAVNQANADGLLTDARSTSPRPTPFDGNFLAIMSEFKVVKKCISGSDNANCWDATGEKYGLSYSTGYPKAEMYAFIDASGMAWTQYWSGANRVFVDTNGFKKPNQWGKDRFVFHIRDKNNVDEGNMDVPIKVIPVDDYTSPGNTLNICDAPNKCATENNYFGKSWLFNKN